jgi:hypothetical protein
MRLSCELLVDTARRECNISGGSPEMLDRRFRTAFGTSIVVVVKLWNRMENQNLVPPKSQVKHILWMLSFLKTYLPEEEYRRAFRTSEKTFRKWVWLWLEACADLSLVRTMTSVRQVLLQLLNILFYLFN